MDYGSGEGQAVIISSKLKTLLHVVGIGLAIGGVGFVIVRIQSYSDQLQSISIDGIALLYLFLLAFFYGACNLLLARAWWNQLQVYGTKVNWNWAIKTFGTSQIAKYVPGNIFQFAGRQAIGMSAGVSAKALAKSSFLEVITLIFAGGTFLCFLLPTYLHFFNPYQASAVFVIIVSSVYFLLTTNMQILVGRGYIWQTIFLLCSALCFWVVLFLFDSSKTVVLGFPTVWGAFVISWLAGFVTPGSPAGLGVRESVLLLLLESSFTTDSLLVAILVMRFVTVVGDGLFFLFSVRLSNEHILYVDEPNVGR